MHRNQNTTRSRVSVFVRQIHHEFSASPNSFKLLAISPINVHEPNGARTLRTENKKLIVFWFWDLALTTSSSQSDSSYEPLTADADA
jgi:hypothetical protein